VTTGLPDEDVRTSRLPSGWTPLELIKHLVYMEKRWFQWGFTAEQLAAPYGDQDADGRWRVGPEETMADLVAALHAGGLRTRAIVAESALSDVAAIGGRFGKDDRDPHPTLAWIMLHVLQEYARHAGHLDCPSPASSSTVRPANRLHPWMSLQAPPRIVCS
jgi:Protein of unknown function (DUF664)